MQDHFNRVLQRHTGNRDVDLTDIANQNLYFSYSGLNESRSGTSSGSLSKLAHSRVSGKKGPKEMRESACRFEQGHALEQQQGTARPTRSKSEMGKGGVGVQLACQ